MTLKLPSRVRLMLALLLIALMALTFSARMIRWPAAPGSPASTNPGEQPAQTDNASR
jgi:hypothetical protein